jgi:hypothetical protein
MRRESRVLRRAFGAAILALSPASIAAGCHSGSGGNGVLADAALDGEDEDAPPSAPDASCPVIASYHDAGSDAGDGADPGCRYEFPCGLAPDEAGLVVVACGLYYREPSSEPLDARTFYGCRLVEGEGCVADAYTPGPNGAVSIDCPDCIGVAGGRRPRGLATPRGRRRTADLGARLGRLAFDEAASVYAFVRLQEELVRLQAPEALARAAGRAAHDEVLHARLMAEHARARGAVLVAPRVRRQRPRALLPMAIENAVEGCVHETFAAVLARWQSIHAPDEALRRTFGRIAGDEARHAALSWAVAGWSSRRLDTRGRMAVRRARRRAVESLRRRLIARRASPVDAQLGIPRPAKATALLDHVARDLDVHLAGD